MNKSPLPPDLKIRVLASIEDGEITQETLQDDHLVATAPDFITVAHQAGIIVSRNMFKHEWANALSQANDAQKVLIKMDDKKSQEKDSRRLWEAIGLLDGVISSLKK